MLVRPLSWSSLASTQELLPRGGTGRGEGVRASKCPSQLSIFQGPGAVPRASWRSYLVFSQHPHDVGSFTSPPTDGETGTER